MSPTPSLKQISIGYLMFNIPVYSKYLFKQKMYLNVFKFVQSLKWRAFWYLKNKENHDNTNNNSCKYSNIYPTRYSAPKWAFLKPFENALYLVIRPIEFRSFNSHFQKKLINDIRLSINQKNYWCSATRPGIYTLLIRNNNNKCYMKI